MNLAEFLSVPAHLGAVRDAVLQVQRDVAPEEWEVTIDYVGPLIDLAVRDELSANDASGDAGAFGPSDWMLVPIVLTVKGILQTRLETGDTREIAEPEVRGLLSRNGSPLSRSLVSELTGSLRKAFSRHLVGFLTPALGEERHTDISCPRQVWKGTPRFNLVVRLTLAPALWSAADQILDVEAGQTVLIALQAPGFDILNASCQEVVMPPGQDSPPAVFDLRPHDAGSRHLILDFFQTSHPLGTVLVPVEVTEQPAPDAQARAAAVVLSLGSSVPPPDRVLRVSWDPERSFLAMSLIQAGGSFLQDFPPCRMERDPAFMAARLFKELDTLTDGFDPTAEAVRGERRGLSAQAIDDELKVVGQNLWQCLPEELRNLYCREREQWRDGSLLIYSDEPHLPWELVWPYGEGWEDEGPWCLTLCLSRWLRRNEQGTGNVGAPGSLPLTTMACIASTDLEAAQREKTFLHDLLEQRGVRDLSPPDPTREAVMGLLKSEPCEWMHVAAHGNFPDAPEEHSALWLQGRAVLSPRHLIGPAIEDHLRRARPAFLFNACHAGRLGWSLTRIGGWAQRLVSCGAGMFLGPLWAVEDENAFRVAQAFYTLLLEGMTVAEAVRGARRTAREAGNPTWLAYSLYAHPNARIRLSR
jgi:CHAT domain